VAVGEFTGPVGRNANAGPGIQKALIDALRALGVATDARADVTVKGEYIDVRPGPGKGVVLRLRAVVRSRRADEKLAELEADVPKVEDIVKALSLTGPVARFDSASRGGEVVRLIDAPKVHVAGTRVQGTRRSPYAMEVRVRENATAKPKARTPWVDKGQAFVSIERGQLYEVRLYNRSRTDAAVSLTIDGLDAFTFSEVRADDGDTPRYKYFIIPPKKSVRVVGWFRTNKQSDAFEITSYARSAVGKMMADTAEIGTITACFHEAHREPRRKPRRFTRSARSGGRSSPAARSGGRGGRGGSDGPGHGKRHTLGRPDATGIGPTMQADLRALKRRIGALREVVSVRYAKR
jgi:hypothetical protein